MTDQIADEIAHARQELSRAEQIAADAFDPVLLPALEKLAAACRAQQQLLEAANIEARIKAVKSRSVPMVIDSQQAAATDEHPQTNATGTKQCKFCAEEIKAAAILCRYCGKQQEQPGAPRITPNGRSSASLKNWRSVVVFVPFAGLFLPPLAFYLFAVVWLCLPVLCFAGRKTNDSKSLFIQAITLHSAAITLHTLSLLAQVIERLAFPLIEPILSFRVACDIGLLFIRTVGVVTLLGWVAYCIACVIAMFKTAHGSEFQLPFIGKALNTQRSLVWLAGTVDELGVGARIAVAGLSGTLLVVGAAFMAVDLACDELTGKTVLTCLERSGGKMVFLPGHKVEVTPDYKEYDGHFFGVLTADYEIESAGPGKYLIVHYPIDGQMWDLRYQIQHLRSGLALSSSSRYGPVASDLNERGKYFPDD